MSWKLIELPNGQEAFVKQKFSLRLWLRGLRASNVKLITNYEKYLEEKDKQ